MDTRIAHGYLGGQQPGVYILEVRQGPPDPANPGHVKPGHPWFTRTRYRVIPQGTELNNWETEAWKALRLDGSAGSVPADAVWLNRRITELYTTAYNNNALANGDKYLRYVGIAAFASKLVGDSMTAAADAKAGLLGINRGIREATTKGYGLLADGNWAIYMDIYPTTLAYTSQPGGNIQAVRDMQPDDRLLEAWERLHSARANNDANEVWAAGVDMVDYEQRVILQDTVANTPEKLQFWTSFSQNYGWRIRAPYPGARKFIDVVPNGDYGNADHRLEWFHQELYPKVKQWLENHQGGIDVETLLAGGYGT